MTREELIRNLKYTMEKHKNDNVNTFDTNISVMCKDILDYLEQEPSGDLISRSALYDELGNKLTWLMAYGDDVYLDVGSDIKDVIDNMPTAYDVDDVCE